MTDETQTEATPDDVQVEVPDYTGEPDDEPRDIVIPYAGTEPTGKAETDPADEPDADGIEDDEAETETADEPALDTSGDEAQAARYKTIGYPVGADHS